MYFQFRNPLIRSLSCSAIALLVISIAAPRPAFALAFAPSDIEWTTWPDYCKARYVVSAAGKKSKFVNWVSPADVTYHEIEKGPDAWVYLHHYCAALIYMQRAAAEKNPDQSAFILREAEIEFMNQFEIIKMSDPMFPEVVASIAQVHRRRGDTDVALEFLELAIKHQPSITTPYALAAIICREAGDIDRGLKFLERGNSATDGKSAEIHYFLGLFYVDLDDLDAAVAHAELAYELGYPLPGLASKLRRHGRKLK